MRVLVENRSGRLEPRDAFIEEVCLFAMGESRLPESTELSVVLVDEEEIAALNMQYRGIEGPTDVLSFECDNLDDDFPAAEDGAEEGYTLGDIAIAPSVAMRQAREYGTSFDEEMELLLVHGVLHLCGYDHIDDLDAEEMERRQQDILKGWRVRRAEA